MRASTATTSGEQVPAFSAALSTNLIAFFVVFGILQAGTHNALFVLFVVLGLVGAAGATCPASPALFSSSKKPMPEVRTPKNCARN